MGNTKETFSLTRALAKVKVYESQIQKFMEINNAISDLKSVSSDTLTYSKRSANEFLKQAKGNIQSLEDIYENRRVLKSAIAKANIETRVIFNDKEYSIFDLMDMKQSLYLKRAVYVQWQKEVTKMYMESEKVTEKILKTVQEQAMAAMGSGQPKSGELNSKLYDDISKQLSVDVVSALSEEEIKVKIEEIDSFLAEVDMTLSEVNARTEITVEL